MLTNSVNIFRKDIDTILFYNYLILFHFTTSWHYLILKHPRNHFIYSYFDNSLLLFYNLKKLDNKRMIKNEISNTKSEKCRCEC